MFSKRTPELTLDSAKALGRARLSEFGPHQRNTAAFFARELEGRSSVREVYDLLSQIDEELSSVDAPISDDSHSF